MEDRKAYAIAATTIIFLIVFIILARTYLELTRPFFLIAGADIAVILGVFACLIVRETYQRRKRLIRSHNEGRELRIEYSFLRKVSGAPKIFTYKELQEATDHFRLLLGRGSSGTVFKGVLNDGSSVAVKRIGGDHDHSEKAFRSEVAAIASVQHVNLVRILGYCIVSGGCRYLVYEFIPNGSLDYWIFPKKRSGCDFGGCLSWDLRCTVAVDVAKALAYLHNDCRSRVLHLDVKPENILLDENYRAIVSDFGLSKLMGRDESRVLTNVRGTKGYLAPEWLLEQGISEKTDVYSYGMVLFEMIGGRRNVCRTSQEKWEYFPKIVREKKREGKLMEIVDERIARNGGIDERGVRKLVDVAFWCIQENDKLRPSMARVVKMLEGQAAVEEPPDSDMVIVDLLAIDDDSLVVCPGKVQATKMAARNRSTELENDGNTLPTTSCSCTLSVLSGR